MKTREVKVRSPARKSRTQERIGQLAHHALPPPMPYSSLEESPTSAVPVDMMSMMRDVDGLSLRLPHVPPNVARRQVGRVADGAPVVGRQRGHLLCSIPEDKLSHRAFALAVMANVVPGRRTMRYGVEVSWALPLKVAHSGEAKRPGASLSRRSWFRGHRAS